MAKQPITWIAVVDGAQARGLVTMNGREFTVVDTLASDEAHVPTHDLVSDRLGRGHESMASAHHAIEARHDPHALVKQAFLRGVADRLRAAAGDNCFDRLVLVAPRRQLGKLRAASTTKCASKKVAAEHDKDLAKLPAAELSQRLAALLQRQ